MPLFPYFHSQLNTVERTQPNVVLPVVARVTRGSLVVSQTQQQQQQRIVIVGDINNNNNNRSEPGEKLL